MTHYQNHLYAIRISDGKVVSIDDRQKLLAHASTTTTKIYNHPNFELAMQYVNQVPKYGLV
jgi:site-specific recombinase XerC